MVAHRLKHDFRHYLSKIWYDAVAYGPEELEFVSATIGRAGRYATREQLQPRSVAQAEEDKKLGSKRMLWGTDHPFFPPINGDCDQKWRSVVENLEAIREVTVWDDAEQDDVRGQNAIDLFKLGRAVT